MDDFGFSAFLDPPGESSEDGKALKIVHTVYTKSHSWYLIVQLPQSKDDCDRAQLITSSGIHERFQQGCALSASLSRPVLQAKVSILCSKLFLSVTEIHK